MRIAISQPSYLGHAAFFELIAASDVFCLLDNVQFSRQSWQQRNRVRFPDGRIVWLTVPVRHNQRQRLDQVEIASGREWATKHWRTLQACYQTAPGWPRLERLLRPVYSQHSFQYLADLTTELILLLAGELGITTPIHRASRIVAREGREERLVDLCAHFGASEYLSVRGASYLGESLGGVPVCWFDPAPEGEPHLSVVHLIAEGEPVSAPPR